MDGFYFSKCEKWGLDCRISQADLIESIENAFKSIQEELSCESQTTNKIELIEEILAICNDESILSRVRLQFEQIFGQILQCIPER